MKLKTLKKALSFLATVALLINSLGAPFAVLAQEVTPEPTPTPIVEQTPEASPSETPVISPSPEESVTPAPQDSTTPTPEVTVEATPSGDQTTPAPETTPIVETQNNDNVQSQGPPSNSNNPITQSSNNPISTSAPTPAEHGNITTTTVENIDLSTINLLNSNVDGATVTTDKPDYSPTSMVLITGTGFFSNKTYDIVVSSSDEPPVTNSDSVTADAQGTFTYSYQLDGNYRPNYKVEVKSREVVVASTTFTDSRTVNSVTLNGASSVTLAPSALITVNIQATTDWWWFSDNAWKSTDWRIGNSGSWTCVNHANHSGDGTYNESFTIHAPATTGTYSISFRAYSDDSCSNGQSSAKTLSNAITVTPANTAPLANNDSYSVNEESVLNIAAAGVLTNDTDANSDPLTAVKVTNPTHGTLTLNANGSLTYTPVALFYGADSFTYKANDGKADSNIATVYITVNFVDHAPTANDDSAITNENSPVTIDVLANDTDPDTGDFLTIQSTGYAGHGSVSLDSVNWKVIYTPNTNYAGTDSFQYRARDSQNVNSNYATVTVNVVQTTGTFIVKKHMVGGTGTFSFTGNAGGQISANDGTITSPNVPAGSYSVSETTTDGWNLTGITCDDANSSGNISNRTATFVVDPGETVTCTFTNTKLGSVSGHKWSDLNGNGIEDPNEPRLSGWEIGYFKYDSAHNSWVSNAPDDVFTNSNGEYSFTNLEPGQYYVTEYLQGGWDLTYPIGGKNYFTINPGDAITNLNFGNHDVLPPVITIDPYNLNWTNQDITVTASTNEGSLNATSHTFIANGSFTFIATDASGNSSSQTVTITNIDKGAPTVTSVSSDGQTYNLASANPTVKITFSEDIANIPTVDAPVMGSAPAINNCGDADAKTFCFIYTLPPLETTETLQISDAQDIAGNVMALDQNHKIVFDRIAPTADINYSTTAPVNADVLATLVNPSEPITINSLGGGTHTFTTNGSFTFTFIDAAGNAGSAIATVTNIDKTAPIITIGDYNHSWTNQDIVVTATTNEGTLNADSHTFTENGSFDFIATDAAGNTTTRTVTISNIDRTGPVLSSQSFFGSTWYNGWMESIFTYWDENGIASGNNPDCWVKTEGEGLTCTVNPDVTDNAGNHNTTPVVSNPVNVDYSIPTGSWITPEAGSTVSGIVPLEVNATDGAGITSVVFQYKGDGDADFITINTVSNAPYVTNWDTTSLSLGIYTLRAIVSDHVASHQITLDENVGIAALISGESANTFSTSGATISWITDRPTSTRVVYDTVQHPTLDLSDPNYGYAYSTGLSDTSPEVYTHFVTINGLADGTLYYYRVVSAGSPVAIGNESGFQTYGSTGATLSSGNGGGVLGASTSSLAASWSRLAYNGSVTTNNVLGAETNATATPEATVAPTAQSNNFSLINWIMGHKKISLGTVLVLILIGYLLFRRKNS